MMKTKILGVTPEKIVTKNHIRFFFFCLLVSLSCLSSAQSNRLWSTYYGEAGNEGGYSVATDTQGNVYLAGGTNSATGIASGGFQNTLGGGSGYDAFLVKLDAAGNRIWATYYGGSGTELALGVATDASGNVYLTGQTNSPSGIASGGFQNTIGGGVDAFLVKFDGNGNRLWATYYGGTVSDIGWSVATDALGNAYLSGWTESSAGIASGGFQNTIGGLKDAFLVKFDAVNGNRIWATYCGGTIHEWGYKVVPDASGNVYLAGSTYSSSGISSGGYQNIFGGGTSDAFLVKFDVAGNLLWGTYYGGTGDDVGWSVATDASGNVYLAGETNSAAGIASGGFQNVIGGLIDDFLVKFDPSGNLLWATYYGGTDDEELGKVAVDAGGNVYLCGDTYSTAGISSGGFQNNLIGLENQFVAKFDSSGNRLCVTYYGQVHEEDAYAAVDGFGNVYLSGTTPGPAGMASGGFQNTFGGGPNDAYLVKFSSCYIPLSTTANSANIACNGQCTGSGTANPSNGNAPYTYSWNTTPVQTTQTATGLCAGSYTVTVKDPFSSITATVAITEPPLLTSNNLSTTNITCNALCTGSATINPAGGTPAYTYVWNTVPPQSTAAATGLCAGNYTATVTDANGCIQTQTITITEPSVLMLVGTYTPANCVNNDGAAAVNASGGTASYTYSWNNNQTTQTASGLVAGIYTATVTDANGCTQTEIITVPSVNTLSLSTSSTQAACNSPTGSATANPAGGNSPYTYSWSNNQTTQTATGLITGTYTVIITDANGCIQTTSTAVASFGGPSVTLSAQTNILCNGDNNGSATVSVSAGTAPYTYSWNTTPSQTTATANGLVVGNYLLTVTDSNGCTATQTVTITEPLALTATVTSTPAECNNSNGEATVIPSGGTGAFIYLWNPTSQTTATATALDTGSYTITITDANGCTHETSITLTETPCPCPFTDLSITVPNAFSPNGDGENDAFCLPASHGWPAGQAGTEYCIKELKIIIYNRWGEKVYESADSNFCWDGYYNGGMLNTAVFVYYMKIILKNNTEIIKQGNISLIQ